MTSQPQPNIVSGVMGAIEQRRIKMRPRRYFILLSVLLGGGIGSAIITAIICVALVAVRLLLVRPLGVEALPWPAALIFFPWLPALLAVVGLVAGTKLLRRAETGYRRSALVVGVAVMAIIIGSGAGAGYVAFHNHLHESRLATVFPGLAQVASGWVTGTVTTIDDTGFTVTTAREGVVRVTRDATTMLVRGQSIELGRVVRVIGRWDNQVLRARVINADPVFTRLE